ncbi:SGNH hydrolase-like domain-containing protein, acetyltransferase AlgX [Pseudobutyrivibrio sp. UC1225]|nr:SGNH hydrolase-like domain-containing protein, acetyltransferase AlgX [Pseudobutyrivibrio sp. UC1225]
MKLTNLKNKIFILVFLALLVLPWVGGGMLRLFSEESYNALSVVETEKRQMQEIEWSNLINTGESVSGFIDDRIPFRYTLISAYKSINNVIDGQYQKVATAVGQMLYSAGAEKKDKIVERGQTNKPIVPGEEVQVATEDIIDDDAFYPLRVNQDVIVGRFGWLFLYGENEYECYVGSNILSEDEMQHYVNLVNQLQSICAARGKELYVLIAPNKSSVYPKYMPTVEKVDDWRRISRLYEKMQNEAKAPFIYPIIEELEASGTYQVYYKYDSHWNHLGGLYGTNALYAAMGVEQTDPASWIVGTQDADKYELYTYMGIPDSMVTHDDAEYTVDYRPDVTVNGLNVEKMICRTTSNGANEKKLCLIGDSFRVNMMPYISKDFTNCTFVHRDYMKEVSSDIKNADIIVIEAVERYDYEGFKTIQKVINLFSN